MYLYIFPARSECIYTSFPLVLSVFIHLSHSFRVYLYIFPTRSECIYTSFPLVPSVFIHLSHPFRVCFTVPPLADCARSECSFHFPRPLPKKIHLAKRKGSSLCKSHEACCRQRALGSSPLVSSVICIFSTRLECSLPFLSRKSCRTVYVTTQLFIASHSLNL